MAKREIQGAVRLGGQVYTAGREDELAEALGAKEAERLTEAGAITGDWSGARKSAKKDEK